MTWKLPHEKFSNLNGRSLAMTVIISPTCFSQVQLFSVGVTLASTVQVSVTSEPIGKLPSASLTEATTAAKEGQVRGGH